MGNSQGSLDKIGHRFSPMLHGVREEGGECLSWMVDQVGARLNIVAGSPYRRRGFWRQLCKGFYPREVGVPGSL